MTRDLTRRATARDVAQLAEVSVATVSLIANGKSAGRVTPETEQRVRSAIQQLDYRINTTASALARGRRDTVAFVSPDPANPFFSLVLDGLASALDESLSLTILWPRHGDDYDPSTVQRALAGDLAGLVLASPGATLLDTISPTCPTILLESGETRAGMASMDLDVEAAGTGIADHLVGLGHRRVGYLGVERDRSTLNHRRDAVERQLQSRGAALSVPDLMVQRMTTQSAYDAALPLLGRWVADGVTAVVCADDLLAYGVLRAAHELDIPVPGTLSIAGFGNLPYSSMVAPSLTSVDLSARELGVRAGNSLNGMLLGSDPAPNETLRTTVVGRNSTARALV
ncbi:MAG: LacI family transcriptional regulator [Actinobacteria bacterium]|nr:LacI family transcriptional regulator [Actinomycetota bacterium]